jgi:hypothetical protein
MQPLFKRMLTFGAVAFIFLFISLAAISAGQENPPIISGSILMNIKYFRPRYVEFKLKEGKLLKISEGEVIDFRKDGQYTGKSIDSSDQFRTIFNHERLYYFEKEDLLEALLSPYDLEALDNLRARFVRNHGKLENDKHFLTGPGKKYQYFTRYAHSFLPNRQFSYAIYYLLRSHRVCPLINLTTKEISFPFGRNQLGDIVWNTGGQSVAYSTRRDQGNSLLIHDISENKILLRKSIDKYISDITWSPDSSALALLTYTERTSTSPGDILACCAGHPYPIRTFYLEVYNLSGNLLYDETVVKRFILQSLFCWLRLYSLAES